MNTANNALTVDVICANGISSNSNGSLVI